MNTIQTAASMSNTGSNAGPNSDQSSLSHNQSVVASTKIVADPLTYEKSIYKRSMPLHMGVGPIPEISVVVPVYNEEENVELQERVPVPIPESVLHAHDGSPGAKRASHEAAPMSNHNKVAIRADKSFWMTVVVIELTDIAFAVDSILAAIGLVGPPPAGHPETAFHPKLWVVVTGGLLGIVLMRVAATMFIRLLEKFPRFELSAYLLIIVIGLKLLADWAFNSQAHPHAIDFHNYAKPEFWIFWLSMVAAFGVGFLPARKSENSTAYTRPTSPSW